MFELDVLGPLILRSDGHLARLRPMEREVLLALYCANGSALSPQRLESLLWDQPAEHSPVTLRRHIAGTRKAAAGEVVVTHRQGRGATTYGLGISEECIDAVRFQRQVTDGCREFRQGWYEGSAYQLEGALKLWRGAPLADAAGRPFAQAQIARLESTHQTAVITKLKASISLGQHREATGELEALAANWAQDSEVWRLLVICLYRSERPMEAARVCRRAIETLRSQGLDDRLMLELQRDTLRSSLPRQGPVFPAVDGRLGSHRAGPGKLRYLAGGNAHTQWRETSALLASEGA
jgi:DNA-binding SARP family transcriptional activator